MTTTTLDPAGTYRHAAQQMRSDARAFRAIAEHVEEQARYLTFGPSLAQRMRAAYEGLAAVFAEAAAQADQIADTVDWTDED